MPGRRDLPMRIARCYDLPLQVSSFFALLILSECITQQSVSSLGQVDVRILAHKLRRALQGTDIEVRSRRTIGYWLDDDVRRSLASKFNVELGIST
jgi:hypothetical protein